MRKPLVVASLVLALSVLAPPVSSQAAPKHDQVTGTGTAGKFGDPQLHVNAVQAPTGEKGGFTIRYPAGPDRLNFSAGLPVDPKCGRNDLAIPTAKIVADNFQVFDARD